VQPFSCCGQSENILKLFAYLHIWKISCRFAAVKSGR
jgi:hypothetical protein